MRTTKVNKKVDPNINVLNGIDEEIFTDCANNDEINVNISNDDTTFFIPNDGDVNLNINYGNSDDAELNLNIRNFFKVAHERNVESTSRKIQELTSVENQRQIVNNLLSKLRMAKFKICLSQLLEQMQTSESKRVPDYSSDTHDLKDLTIETRTLSSCLSLTEADWGNGNHENDDNGINIGNGDGDELPSEEHNGVYSSRLSLTEADGGNDNHDKDGNGDDNGINIYNDGDDEPSGEEAVLIQLKEEEPTHFHDGNRMRPKCQHKPSCKKRAIEPHAYCALHCKDHKIILIYKK